MATIRVEIVSAEGEIFSGDAQMLFAPAQMGELGIAPRHAPLLTNLKPGEGASRNVVIRFEHYKLDESLAKPLPQWLPTVSAR